MLVVALASGVLVFFSCLFLIEFFTRNRITVSRRIRRYAAGEVASWEDTGKRRDYLADVMQFIRYLGLKVRGVPQAKRLEIKMQQAGWPLLGSEFLVLIGVVVFAAGIMGMMLTLKVVYAVIIGLLAGMVCLLYLNIKIARRQKEFSEQLGDVLDMMANAMRSGFSFMQAMDLIAKEMKPPVSVEFYKVLTEIRLGADTEAALLHMGERVRSADLDLVLTAVLIQREVGGNLAQILDNIATTINERIKMKREIKTLTAQGRMSGWVLAGLPLAIAFLTTMVNPGYMRPFIDEPLGRAILTGSIISEIIGFLIIRRIITIDV